LKTRAKSEKKFEKLLKKMLDAPPPGYQFEPRLVPIDQNGQNKAANSAGA